MSFLGFYLIFALATALATMYEIFIPVLKELEKVDSTNVMLHNKYQSYAILIGLGVIYAPVLFPVILVPRWSEWFHNKVLHTLIQDE